MKIFLLQNSNQDVHERCSLHNGKERKLWNRSKDLKLTSAISMSDRAIFLNHSKPQFCYL